MENILLETEKILKNNNKYVSDDGKLLKALVYTDVMNTDDELLSLLISNEKIKKYFFKKVNDTLVFDKQKFAWFIESKEFLPDSYTRYKNKLGLAKDGKLLSEINDVVLEFPYKDCVLEGGQDKEDQKRNEIFYHETIAGDQINRLLSPKVFTNAKRYYKDGVDENVTLDDNDNLIIKGNNVVILNSLLKRYEGKVNCIFIDPPYNTENGTFNYNDTFNHSTWLTFMKNRLEVARRLLSEDGSIYITIDYNEIHYLKVLMDDIFGADNFQREIIWRMGFLSGYKTAVNNFVRNHDTILFYSKNNKQMKFNKLYIPNSEFNPLLKKNKTLDKKLQSFGLSDDQIAELYKHVNHESRGEKYPLEDTWNCNKWDDLNSIAIDSSTSKVEETVDLDGSNFKGQKPEKLLRRIIESSTKEGDIVLDFFAGTGTTMAAAHKLKRKYIGIEQMDYINETIIPRMISIINGDKSGISKDVKWSGGGSFVYCELLENAKVLLDEINKTNEDNIQSVKEKIYSDDRIIPFIQTQDLNKVDADFNKLNLEEKKNALCLLIDKNKLYVNYSDIDDEEYVINNSDKNFTNSFYKGGK